MEKIIYTESQKFNQWWLYLILSATTGVSVWAAYVTYRSEGPAGLVALAISLLVTILLASLSLKTTISERNVRVGFWFWTKTSQLDEIEDAYVRTYSPLGEYGGWGIRGFGDNRAFNTYGDQGLQLLLKDGRKVLIGTQQPEVIQRAICEALGKTAVDTPAEELDLEGLRERVSRREGRG